MAVETFNLQDVFGGKNTSALNQNGIYEVRQKDNLVPMLPDIYRVNSSGLNRHQGALTVPSPLGARLQLGDVTDPSAPTYMRFTCIGNSFGLWYGIDIGDTNGATNLFFQDSVVKIDGEAFIPNRTLEMGYTNTPFAANSRAMGRAVWTDLGDEPYIVEIRTPGDRAYTPLTSITKSGTTATATVTGTNWISIGAIVNIVGDTSGYTYVNGSGVTTPVYNGSQTVTGVSGSTFTFTLGTNPPGNATGTLTAGASNRFVIYAVLVDAKYYGTGSDTHLSYVTAAVPTSMTAVGSWSNTGSRGYGIVQLDVTNSTAAGITMAFQIDGSNTTHYTTVAANDTYHMLSLPRPVGADGSVVRIQAGGAGLRYTMFVAGGF